MRACYIHGQVALVDARRVARGSRWPQLRRVPRSGPPNAGPRRPRRDPLFAMRTFLWSDTSRCSPKPLNYNKISAAPWASVLRAKRSICSCSSGRRPMKPTSDVISPALPAGGAVHQSVGPGNGVCYRGADFEMDVRHEGAHALLHAGVPAPGPSVVGRGAGRILRRAAAPPSVRSPLSGRGEMESSLGWWSFDRRLGANAGRERYGQTHYRRRGPGSTSCCTAPRRPATS